MEIFQNTSMKGVFIENKKTFTGIYYYLLENYYVKEII